MDDVIVLVSSSEEQDAYGVWVETRTEKQVFCQVQSVTRQEFYNGGRIGLNPDFQFTVFSGDYSGETICQFHDKQYSIYRTYHVPGTDYLELYVQREGGTNKKAVEPDGQDEEDQSV